MLEVKEPGLFTTVQDLGRNGYQAYGMPVAGAMDEYACKMANRLLGNEPGAAVLEMTLLGGSFFFRQACWVAVTGAAMPISLDGKTQSNWSRFFAPAGSELSFGYAEQGCRTYLAVQGGVDVPVILGSRSTYTRGTIGGLNGRALKAGDVLPLGACDRSLKKPLFLPATYSPIQEERPLVRVLLGPQAEAFTKQGVAALFSADYEISSEADRMGYRLEGPVIEHVGKADIISDALCLGAIQVPGHGQPIVMMADRQTTGGYTKIGAVIGADLGKLAQSKPGDRVRFVQCSDAEAVAALRQLRSLEQSAAAWLAEEEERSTGRQFRIVVAGVTYQVQVQEG